MQNDFTTGSLDYREFLSELTQTPSEWDSSVSKVYWDLAQRVIRGILACSLSREVAAGREGLSTRQEEYLDQRRNFAEVVKEKVKAKIEGDARRGIAPLFDIWTRERQQGRTELRFRKYVEASCFQLVMILTLDLNPQIKQFVLNFAAAQGYRGGDKLWDELRTLLIYEAFVVRRDFSRVDTALKTHWEYGRLPLDQYYAILARKRAIQLLLQAIRRCPLNGSTVQHPMSPNGPHEDAGVDANGARPPFIMQGLKYGVIEFAEVMDAKFSERDTFLEECCELAEAMATPGSKILSYVHAFNLTTLEAARLFLGILRFQSWNQSCEPPKYLEVVNIQDVPPISTAVIECIRVIMDHVARDRHQIPPTANRLVLAKRRAMIHKLINRSVQHRILARGVILQLASQRVGDRITRNYGRLRLPAHTMIHPELELAQLRQVAQVILEKLKQEPFRNLYYEIPAEQLPDVSTFDIDRFRQLNAKLVKPGVAWAIKSVIEFDHGAEMEAAALTRQLEKMGLLWVRDVLEGLDCDG